MIRKFIKKTVIAFMLFAIMGVCKVGVNQVNAETFGDYEYEIKEGTEEIIITKYKGDATNVTFPSEIDGKLVTEIGGGACRDNERITNVTIPEGVKIVSGFSYCPNLVGVILSSGVEEINDAFCGCPKLENINLPDGLKKIKNLSFLNCDGLKEIHIPDSVTSISAGAFQGCDGLKKVFIPQNVNDMGVATFSGWPFCDCCSLQEIIVDEDNTTYVSVDGVLFSKDMKSLIGYPAGKENFEYIIPDGVEEICTTAFTMNKHLKKLILSDSVTYIGNSAFMDCSNITDIELSNNIKIGNGAFAKCSSLINIDLPRDCVMEYDADGVFCKCASLTDIVIPDGLKVIGHQMFDGCSALTNIYVPNTVEEIRDLAFSDCVSLKSICLPEEVKNISHFAFYDISSPEGALSVVIVASKDSYAAKWAIENGYVTVETIDEVDEAYEQAKGNSNTEKESKDKENEESSYLDNNTENQEKNNSDIQIISNNPATEIVTNKNDTDGVSSGEHSSLESSKGADVVNDILTTFTIKNKKTYKKSKKVTVKDKDGIKSIKLNGKTIKIKAGKKSISFKLSKYKKYFKKKGKWNKLVVTDVNGNKKTIQFKAK